MVQKKCSTKGKLNHLIIYCNPNPKSLSEAYREFVEHLTEMSGCNLCVRDLYKIGFKPVLGLSDLESLACGKVPEDVKVEQEYLAWADLLTFIYPVWWTGMPALMKGYIDRVFTKDFAYSMDEQANFKGLLAGKQVVILNNMGFPYEYYEKIGMLHSMKQTTDQGIFEFCGMNVIEHRFFGHIAAASKSEREGHVHVLKLIYDKILCRLAEKKKDEQDKIG